MPPPIAGDLASGALREATDPTTPAARLSRLAAHHDPRIPRAVARNPGTPRELARGLLETYPADALLNPMLPLWLIEQPDLLRQRPQTLAALLSVEPPSWLIPGLQGSWSELSSDRVDLALGKWLARRGDTPAWLLGRLCTSGHRGTRFVASRHPEVPCNVISLLRAAGSDADLRSPVRHRPPVVAARLREAAALGVWGAQLVASHQGTPDDLLVTLAGHSSLAVLETLARRPRLPATAAAALLRHPSSAVREALEANPRRPRLR
jgi:hypothetical protein